MLRYSIQGKNDFNKQNRQRIFNDIKNNDWDCIILTHEQFGMIPQALEIQEAIMQKELDSVEENLEVLRQQGRDISVGCSKDWRSASRHWKQSCRTYRTASPKEKTMPWISR